MTQDSWQIDALAAAFYDAYDNRGGRAPKTAELRALFAADARITRVSADSAETWNVEDFIAPRDAMLTDGTLVDFHEWETEAETTMYENIASRRSLYRKAGTLNGGHYAGQGRKFIQLCRVGGRWLIVSVLWEDG